AIFASGSAFAALRADYSVVVWGATLPPTNPLPGVRHVCGSGGAMAALRIDGTVVTWGCAQE
ncbi:unnamed protein product, partial [Effrenium voratum]